MYLTDLFDDGLAANVKGIAVKYEAGHQLNYAQVNENANIIAGHLRDIGAHYQIIGCSTEPHVNVPSIMLGIIRASAVFFFIDVPSRQFLTEILKNYRIKYFIVQVKSSDKMDNISDRVFESADASMTTIRGLHCGLSDGKTELRLYALTEISPSRYEYPDGWNLAYAVTTSGSTGTPKLVKVPHRCILPNVIHFRNIYKMSSNDVIFVASPLSFDPSVVDIFLALSCGASIVLVSEASKRSTHKLASILANNTYRISIIQATPSLVLRFDDDLLKEVFQSTNTSLRVLSLGGEPCPTVATLRAWMEGCQRGTNGKISIDIYNVYGITEVSSWASLHRVDLDAGDSPDMQYEFGIPLGDAILGTEMIVQTENGERVYCGDGQLFIGGTDRICFIDSEDFQIISKPPLMRPTGDWVRIDRKGQIFHLDRIDDQIKRNGKLISLKQLEKISASFSTVKNARAIWDRSQNRIILAVVIDNYIESRENVIKERLRHHLTSFCVNLPDKIILLDSLPITNHGKFDKRKVISLVDTWSLKDQTIPNENEIYKKLKNIWNSVLILDVSEDVKDDANFLLCGGDSVSALALCEEVRCHLQPKCPQLVDKVLNETFNEIYQYLLNEVKSHHSKSNQVTRNHSIKQYSSVGTSVGCNFISRGSSLSMRQIVTDDSNTSDYSAISFTISWRLDTRKCIDASPLLVFTDRMLVFIGSHSHAFVAVDLVSGLEKWRFTAEDRIESSACVSSCSKYVFVGSYDQYLYCLVVQSGELHWKFKTNGPIKSSPIVHPNTDLVYFGSHDHFVYAVKIEDGLAQWTSKPGNGSVFSSPCLAIEPYHHLYVGTLDGIFCALCPDTGSKLWLFHCGLPIFSSPTLISTGVCVGCVNKTLYCFSHTGSKLWQFVCEAPMFSSPCYHRSDEEVVIVGAHDRHVYCLESATGELRWKSDSLDSEVYSTPFSQGSLIFICTVRGKIISLRIKDGKMLEGEFHLPGDVFSSPIVFNDKLIVGCRDNHLYSLQISLV